MASILGRRFQTFMILNVNLPVSIQTLDSIATYNGAIYSCIICVRCIQSMYMYSSITHMLCP